MSRRALLSLTVVCVLLTSTLSACGGDDDSGDSTDEAQTASASNGREEVAGPKPGRDGNTVILTGNRTEARRAASTTQRVYSAVRGVEQTGGKALLARGGGEICDVMSRRAQRQTIEYVRRSSGLAGNWNCRDAVGLLLGRAQRTGTFKATRKAQIVGVNAEGRRATATVTFGKRKALRSLALVKEDGRWKLAANPMGGR